MNTMAINDVSYYFYEEKVTFLYFDNAYIRSCFSILNWFLWFCSRKINLLISIVRGPSVQKVKYFLGVLPSAVSNLKFV